MKRKTVLIFIFLIIAGVITAVTVIAANRPQESAGQFERDVIDRVRFQVENTDFTLIKSGDEPEEYEITFSLTAEKTEPDFYAILHSVDLEGLEYDSLIFQSDSNENNVPIDLPLPAENGKTVPLQWTVKLLFTSEKKAPVDFSLVIRYSSGITENTADTHILKIPMHITFE